MDAHLLRIPGQPVPQLRTNAPFRAQQGQIHVYSKQNSLEPAGRHKKWTWDFSDISNSPWDTGLPYGSKLVLAPYIAQGPPNGPYVYLIQLITP